VKVRAFPTSTGFLNGTAVASTATLDNTPHEPDRAGCGPQEGPS
jgi:hypothetical protein